MLTFKLSKFIPNMVIYFKNQIILKPLGSKSCNHEEAAAFEESPLPLAVDYVLVLVAVSPLPLAVEACFVLALVSPDLVVAAAVSPEVVVVVYLLLSVVVLAASPVVDFVASPVVASPVLVLPDLLVASLVLSPVAGVEVLVASPEVDLLVVEAGVELLP